MTRNLSAVTSYAIPTRLPIKQYSSSLTHFIPTTTVVVVTLSIPTTTVVVVAHCIPTTTFVVVDNDLSNLSAVNRPRARNPRDTCAVNRMCCYCLCTADIEKVFVQFASRLNEISDDCCRKFVVDFAEMASAHDTVSDVSDIDQCGIR